MEINLSGRTISAPEHVADIERLVSVSGAPAQNIIFEITETAVVENLTAVRQFAERLRALGCSFALDDFGVGFGTFTYLKHLPVDYLKIDIDFVRKLVSENIDRRVVHAIMAVASGFGIKTIAEGVEDQATLELLASMGVDFAQGYWTGRPAPGAQSTSYGRRCKTKRGPMSAADRSPDPERELAREQNLADLELVVRDQEELLGCAQRPSSPGAWLGANRTPNVRFSGLRDGDTAEHSGQRPGTAGARRGRSRGRV